MNTDQKFEQVIQQFDPQAKLVQAQALMGGVSAQITLLEIERTDGQRQKLIMRRHGEVDRAENPQVAAHEFRVLQHLKARGFPVPAPYLLDETCAIFPMPYLVVEYIDGATDFNPPDLTAALHQMTVQLTRIHQVDPTPLAFLRVRPDLMQATPARLDESINEGQIRAVLSQHWPLTPRHPTVLRHGDYWPGNVLFRDGQLVGVIDWEDAALGDPLADLAKLRLECLCFFGLEAMDTLTAHYQLLMPLDYTDLPCWDLYITLKSAFQLSTWAGGDAAVEQKMRELHHVFVAQAMEKLHRGG